jgi:hypothetical protein
MGSFLDHLSPLGIRKVDKSMHHFKKNWNNIKDKILSLRVFQILTDIKLSSRYWRRKFALEWGNVQPIWIQSYVCLFALWTCILSILHLWLFDIISYYSCSLWQLQIHPYMCEVH